MGKPRGSWSARGNVVQLQRCWICDTLAKRGVICEKHRALGLNERTRYIDLLRTLDRAGELPESARADLEELEEED